MKTFLILGAGTAGTMIAKKMSNKLDPQQWKIILVDRDEQHYYQPGFLFLPFGSYKPQDVVQPKRRYIPKSVEFILADIERIEPESNRVLLSGGKPPISYEYLVIATGCDIRPSETEGMFDGGGWRKNIFDFYTYEGALALGKFLEKWPGGRLVVNVAEMPIKCPVAPLEFLFLADDFFTRRGIRNKVELVYATPLSGAFTKPKSSAMLGNLLEKKHIHIEPDFAISDVDSSANAIHSYDGREIPFDLFVTVPVNGGAEFIGRSGMGNDLDFVPTDKFTLQSKKWPNIWVMGDANDIPASKAGAVVHFQLEVVVENILAHMAGHEMHAHFDGHASCYIETGFNKALLIDFNYDTEPLPGAYPVPGIGPFSLLRESTINHWGKLGFRYMYWNLMLRGLPMPVPDKFSMAGKQA